MVDNTELCLFFLIIGLLLASLLRKPAIEGQETMEKVAPKAGGEEGAPQKGGGGAEFKKMDKNRGSVEGLNFPNMVFESTTLQIWSTILQIWSSSLLYLKVSQFFNTISKNTFLYYIRDFCMLEKIFSMV